MTPRACPLLACAVLLLPGATLAAVTDDASNLIVPAGEEYSLSGEHAYSVSVQIDGLLKIEPFDGSNGGSLRL